MQTVIQLYLLAISSMIVERVIERCFSNSPITGHHRTNSDSINTTTWRYSDRPHNFLFDFASLLHSIPRDHLALMVKTSLPPLVNTTDIKLLRDAKALVELILENPDENNAKSCMLHNQTRSILEHKGLYIQTLELWIKPTLTLAVSEHVTYWSMRIYEFFPVGNLPPKRKELASNIASAISRAFYRKKGEKGTLHVDSNQVFFEVGMVTVLIEEKHISLIDPQRKLLFFPFMNRYLPIETSLIQK